MEPLVAGAKHARSWHSHHYCRENGVDRGCAFTNMCLDWGLRFVYYGSPDGTYQRAVPQRLTWFQIQYGNFVQNSDGIRSAH